MNPAEYTQAVLRSCSSHFHIQCAPPDLFHGILGIASEAGELVDALKKGMFHGKASIDPVNLIEELGDLCWYLALTCHSIGVPIEEVMDRNIAKLKARYPDKFTTEAAYNRDLEAERKALCPPPAPED